MLDRTIPFYNTILRCDHYTRKDVILPDGFSVATYKSGYEKQWAELEYSIGDFDSPEEAESYFTSTYLQNQNLTDRILFLLNEDNDVIGSCIAWNDLRGNSSVSSLHWLVVDDKYQGLGLGKALCVSVLNIYAEQSGFPVYIHTQPWSWKAIFLYLSLGFRLQKSDTFSHYRNEYNEAMSALRNVVTEKQFLSLRELSDD